MGSVHALEAGVVDILHRYLADIPQFYSRELVLFPSQIEELSKICFYPLQSSSTLESALISPFPYLHSSYPPALI